MPSVLWLAARLFVGASLTIALSAGVGTLLPGGEWLAWLSPVTHTQNGIRAEEPDIFVGDGLRVVNLTHHFGNDVAPTWSPDGRLAWLSNRDGDFDVYVRTGGKTLNISQNEHGDFEPIWSRDGRLAWVSRNRGQGETVYVWDDERVTAAGRAAAIQNRSLAWAADGSLRWLGLNGLNGAIHIWNDGEIAQIPLDVTALLSLSWSPEGKLAWITRNAYDERSLYLLDVDAGTRPLLLRRGMWISDRVAWSADERLAWGELATSQDFRIVVQQGDERTHIPVTGFVHSLIWSGDGRLLWIDTARAPIGVMRMWDGRATHVIDDDVRNITQPLWSLGGQITWASSHVQRWSVYVWDGQASRQINHPGQDALSPVWVERAG